ncbi:bifunctional diguanylate cyclase/phosphodiesterase [Salinisphaera sp. LB1]|uniref:putative bifunctional diguanylate cyclase/phosphodiesterase n=1 Tax=Salinisphaera sp. LB1 TaxID=2183911 RepID=UPI000D706AEA|nr:EAL domain-containing protein [Salinisphaera sp. LB1]AWN16757.1 diguanylate cyclase/phosphodiesterase (GGDEF & EAL domains) with PAS/PAC sensor(s) [Salinisphaera sp. LB1]
MRLTIAAFHGNFARRLFLRFIVAAALPVLVIALLAYLNTTQVVIGEAHDRLHRSSRNEGMAILDRLELAAALLKYVDQTGGRYSKSSAHVFAALGMVSSTMPRPHMLWGDPAALSGAQALAARARRSAGDPVIGVAGPGAVFMAIFAGPRRPHSQVLIGRLNLGEILGAPSTWPGGTRFCVFTAANGRALNCPNNHRVFEATRHGHKSRVLVPGKRLLVAHWDLFLDSNFHAPMWRIVGLQPFDYASRSARVFYWLLPLVLLLSLLFAGLVGLMQIRRISQPLRKLRAGVQAIARGEFDSRVRIQSRDEFEELGESVNGMARRLGAQFHTLEALAALDRRVLAAANVAELIEQILTQIPRVVGSDSAALIVIDPDLPRIADCYCVKGCGASIENERLSLSEDELIALGREWTEHVRPDEIAVPAYLGPLMGLGAIRVDCLPAREEGRLWAVLLLAYRGEPWSSTDDQSHALADRIAVALAATYRSRQLYRQAHFDALTGLPNRKLYMDRAETLLVQARRRAQRFAVLFIDLDQFKNVNDAEGHTAGDQLLKHAATRITGALHEADIAARWGGDEFVVLLSDSQQMADIDGPCERLIEGLGENFVIGSIEYHVGASIGIAVYPDDGETIEALLANADAAMYEAKAAGRGCYVFFEPRMNEAVRRRVQLETELRQAVARQEFFLEYQPLIRPADGEVGGAEALLRWCHPTRGIVPPGEFIAALEQTGLIVEVGAWVLAEACRQVASGFTQDGRAPDQVMVNVSPRQFWASDFVATVDRVLADSGVDASRLEIEITENLLLSDLDAACDVAEQLRARGLQLAMDDFGTGYSSLSYLRRLPVDTVKIDQAFATGIEITDSEASTVVRAMIEMLHALNRRVVVEGIENEQQFAFVRAAGCDLAQGFYMSRPVAPEALYDFQRPGA